MARGERAPIGVSGADRSRGEEHMATKTQPIADVHREMQEAFGRVPEWAKQAPPAALAGMWATMRDFQLAETRIPNKYKELIGLAVSGATRCHYCALFHTEAAKLFGATDEEIAEASAMGGWTMMASTFINAQQVDFPSFQKETKAIVEHVRKTMAASPSAKTPSRDARA